MCIHLHTHIYICINIKNSIYILIFVHTSTYTCMGTYLNYTLNPVFESGVITFVWKKFA